MKNYEKESLFKNFLVFFSLLEILLILLFLELYHTAKREYRQSLFKTMQVCSYTYACDRFMFDFTPKKDQKISELYEKGALFAYFPIPGSEKFNLKITYPQEKYHADIDRIEQKLWIKFTLATLLLLSVALFFTFYSLNPIRRALRINDEFIKDILHDFNTPISSIVLNIKMFKDEYPDNHFLKRISQSIDTILLLQNNLKSFLYHSPSQNSSVDIGALALQRLEFMQNLYPKITFVFHKENELVRYTNAELLIRILDNLLSNAAKYNKPHGKVTVKIIAHRVYIEDTGKGIMDPSTAMKRYQKEQERGLGLGLHIVQKLSNELNIKLEILSKPDEGTTVILDFSNLRGSER